jgi:hypothetical protein
MGKLVLSFVALLAVGADLPPFPSDVVRMRAAPLEPRDLGGESFRLELFDDVAVDAVRESRIPAGPEGFVWIGRARGDETSSLVISTQRGAVSASLRLASGQYRVRPSGPGLHRVEEVAPFSEPFERQPLQGPRPRSLAPAGGDDGRDLDLLVLFTPRARRAAGGVDAISALVALGVAEANLALEKSEVDFRLRLVEMREAAFAESGRIESDLEILREGADGALDEAHALRDEYGADLVQLVVEEGDGCGIAYSMGRADPSVSEWAFSVVERACIDTTYAMAHEIGHNLGCDHAPDDPTTRAAFEYSFGYKDLVAGFRTVMAYGAGRRVARFSNPRILFDGVPAGTILQDNARSLNELRAVAAGFRRSVPPPRITASPDALSGATTRVRIEAEGPPIREWRLLLGTSPGASDVLDSGPRFQTDSLDVATSSYRSARHGRLWYRRGAIWRYFDFASR